MEGHYKLRGYIVRPRSIEMIRRCAGEFREILGLSDCPIHLESFLENFSSCGVTIDVMDDLDGPDFLNHTEACCIPESATIYLSEDTYRRACHNDPRTRFTIMHELGHLILGHSRAFHRDLSIEQAKPYIDSEWQADWFAAETLMPLNIIVRDRLFSPKKIQERFGVSRPASEFRYNKLLKRRDIKN